MSSEQWVESFDRTKLFVSKEGTGLPVLLCDWIACDGFIWRHIWPALRDEFGLIEWHYRGHGRSQAPVDPEAVDAAAFRRDILSVLASLGIDKAVLLGFSVGVQLALDFAVHYPERTLGVVAMCGSYGRPLNSFHDNRLLSMAFPVIRDVVLRWPRAAQWVWSEILRSGMPWHIAVTTDEIRGELVERGDMERYFHHLAQLDLRLLVRMLDQLSLHTVEPRLNEIKSPTLVIAGERDTFTPVWLSRRMQRLIVGAEIMIVPRSSHVTALEFPELVVERLRRFLRERIRVTVTGQSSPARHKRGHAAARSRRRPPPEA